MFCLNKARRLLFFKKATLLVIDSVLHLLRIAPLQTWNINKLEAAKILSLFSEQADNQVGLIACFQIRQDNVNSSWS